jgi:hypothetical protein
MFINEQWLGLERLLGLSRVSLLDPKTKAAASLWFKASTAGATLKILMAQELARPEEASGR